MITLPTTATTDKMALYADLLRDLPVSVNNLADPVILRDSTAAKMQSLIDDRHAGAVAIITKGNLNNAWWREHLAYWAAHLNLFLFVSISELGQSYEKGASIEQRYRNLTTAREAGAKAIAYIRPIIHTVNDSPATIRRMFTNAVAAGCHAIVSSGFRGDEQTVEDAGLLGVAAPDGQYWSKILKLTPQTTAEYMVELAAQLGVPYWTRTQCAVAALSGYKNSLNPYHIAPSFVGCDRCPIADSCLHRAQFLQPKAGSIELLRHLGFEVEVHTAGERFKRCDVQRRQECTLCCTNCPVAPANFGVPYVNIRAYDGSIPSWGEMSFARFLTGGVLCTDPQILPGEFSEVRLHPRFNLPDGMNGQGGLYGVNSWMIWSEYVPKNKCFKCSYCFLNMFADQLPEAYQKTVGISPVQILSYENV